MFEKLFACATIQQVDVLVCHEAIVQLGQFALVEIAISVLGSFGQHVSPDRISPKLGDQLKRARHITQTFGHLLVVLQPVAVRDDFLREGQSCLGQKERVVNAVELSDVLANDVGRARDMPWVEGRTIVAQHSQIVHKSIKPNIDGLIWIRGHLNAPMKSISGSAD